MGNRRVARYRFVLVLGLLAAGTCLVRHVSAQASPGSGKPTKDRELLFEVVKLGELIDQRATDLGFSTEGDKITRLAFTIFRSSDGEKVELRHATFASADEAKRYFDWTIQGLKILKKGQTFDERRRAVGWRAEISLPPNGGAVMWTDGGDFRAIYSADLAHALELAKRYGIK